MSGGRVTRFREFLNELTAESATFLLPDAPSFP